MPVRVHQELLQHERLPGKIHPKELFEERYRAIRKFERYLCDNGTVVLKFFLHVSKKEQKARLLERLENPRKFWKFSIDDVKEREYWDDYMDSYETMNCHTATKRAPWYVVPADNKWFTRAAVGARRPRPRLSRGRRRATAGARRGSAALRQRIEAAREVS